MKTLPLTEIEDKARGLEEDAYKLHIVVGTVRFHTILTDISEGAYIDADPPRITITLAGGGLNARVVTIDMPSETFSRVFATLRSLVKSEAYKAVTDVAGIMPAETYEEFMGELRDAHVQVGIEEG